MAHKPDWHVRWAEQKDEADLLRLFQASFGHEMPVEQWRWKYAKSDPLGACVLDRDKMIAFYGGMPRGIHIAGEKALAVQIGDVMVAPGQRGVFTRRGAMFRAAAEFSTELVGQGRKYACGYGFPSERHNRLGEHLGLYARIGKLQQAAWQPINRRPSLLLTVGSFGASELGVLPQLWQEMAASLNDKVVLDRDAEYFKHRFLSHPCVKYLCFLVRGRLTGKPVGLIVLRDHGEEGVELLDLIGSVPRMPMLVRVAQYLCGRLKRSRLFAWMADTVVDSVQETEPVLTDLDLPLPIIAWEQEWDLSWTTGRWWLIGGDTDFR